MDIGGHPPISIGSSYSFLVQLILLYFFVIVGSTLLWMSKALHMFQVDTCKIPDIINMQNINKMIEMAE